MNGAAARAAEDRTMQLTGRPSMLENSQAQTVAALHDPAAFGPECASVAVLETHISFVFLTGRYAYKIKKAIAFPFVDFTSLSARRRSCEEELHLNRRTAADLYLDVVAVTETGGRFTIGGAGEIVEWAVRMREFPQDALLSGMLARGELTVAHVDELATTVAQFHERIDRARGGAGFGSPGDTLDLALANFSEMRPLLDDPADRSALDRLQQWTEHEHAACRDLMSARRREGFVREGHGDLHLGNVALFDGRVTPFDCLEFDARLRWCDVMSEVAFTTMDLRARGRPDLARRFLNAYLEITGDYGGLPVLRFHLVYRALVRAKVACLRAAQAKADVAAASRRECRRYLDLAAGCAAPSRPAIVVMHGLAGCGKTSVSQQLLERADFVRIRTDVERKRMHGFAAKARTGSGLASGVYAPDASRATYHRILGMTRVVVAAGHSVVVDGAFLRRSQRNLFRKLAAARHVGFTIFSISASEAILRERLARRLARGADASEADIEVLAHQLRTQEPFAPDEQRFVVTYATDGPLVAAATSNVGPDVFDQVLARGGSSAIAPALDTPVPADPELAAKVAFLSRADSYPEPTSRVDVVETHLSWVFLTDRRAYKLKKPVRLDDLDFSTTDARRRNCLEEIRLNRRLSRGVYLGETRLAINANGALELDGPGRVVDWLVRMRRLPRERMLDVLLRESPMRHAEIVAIVTMLSRFYQRSPAVVLSANDYRRGFADGIAGTREELARPEYGLPVVLVERIAEGQQRFLRQVPALFGERIQRGRVIEAHGDLRPEHICLEREPQIIDCLEFSREFRTLDTVDELAFLALECERLGAPALRSSIFAAYRDLTDDAAPEALVDFYQSYRALLRAKIAIRHLNEPALRDLPKWPAQAREYLRLAHEHIGRLP